MQEQIEHVFYTRKEWTTVPIFVEMINFLKDKNINCFLDIGANVGEVSKILLETYSTLKKVYAYEPQTDNFIFLQQRFLKDPRLVPIKKAMYYQNDKTFNKIALFNKGGSGSYTVATNTNLLCESVDYTTFEEENLDKIDLAKIDIEGAEYNILKYSEELKRIKYLIIEFHAWGTEDKEFEDNIPLGPERHNERVAYIKKFTDDFISRNLPNYKVVLNDECQYLLELKNDT